MNITSIEICNKETEELIATEGAAFLTEKVSRLKEKNEEFIYIESAEYEAHKIDAIVFEYDEMFNVYSALFGLRLKKMYSAAMQNFFKENLTDLLGSSSAIFEANEGIWEINIALNAIKGFTGEETIEEANALIVDFVDQLVAAITAE
ncbi:hypothetical protein [Kurthia sibirica]|uniref:Uncharacterized protein n=1 Tax=Kurthia sibirica TaxID=202750 RepID=A0A2U3APX3_9BACL|nr:hypothetical protein [Kurthia sibirica]PWI26591.1 hypothetical protein DEX24_02175 [Kurthia sibirica]GEK32848.1 hypothetical protein KSI01_03810 [Kurthia sibirica]